MEKKAEDYEWSSARCHCGLADDPLLKARPTWRKDLNDIANWSQWLGEPDAEQALLILRRNAMMGLPYGSEKFIKRVEKLAGRSLRFNPQGRPKKLKAAQQREASPFFKVECPLVLRDSVLLASDIAPLKKTAGGLR